MHLGYPLCPQLVLPQASTTETTALGAERSAVLAMGKAEKFTERYLYDCMIVYAIIYHRCVSDWMIDIGT